MGRACGTHGRRETCTGFWWESLKEEDHLNDQGVDEIKLDFRVIDWGAVERIHLVQNRDFWRVLLYAVTKLQVLAPWIYLYVKSTLK
jgi:hypothetical protein